MALTKKQENTIEECFITDIDVNECARISKCHVNTVKKRYAKMTENNRLFSIKKNAEEAKMIRYESIPDMIKKDPRSLEVVNTILELWTSEDYIKTLSKDGRHSDINKIFGTVTDKGFKVKEMELREKQHELNKETADKGIHLHVDNNIDTITKLITSAKPTNVNKDKEIEEFKND